MSRGQVRHVIRRFDGEQLLARRLALGMTQEDLARAVDVTLRTVTRWEHGSNAPSDTVLALARVLNVHPEDLYVEEESAA